MDQQVEKLRRGEPLSETNTLNFPVSNVDGFTVHLERTFFGVRIKNVSDPHKYVGRNFSKGELIDGRSAEQVLTNMEYVKVRGLFFVDLNIGCYDDFSW